MIVQNISRDGYTDLSFTMPRGDYARAKSAIEEIAGKVGATGVVRGRARGQGVDRGRRHAQPLRGGQPHVRRPAKENINIQMISTSEIGTSCVIEDKYAELAVRTLHDTFALATEQATAT
jgi:aspartate kinase